MTTCDFCKNEAMMIEDYIYYCAECALEKGVHDE